MLETESHMQARLTMSSHYIAPRQLNDDILLFVLSLSSLHTATSMMATCHFLYHEGAKVILHDSPMSFEEKMSDDKAISLLRFIQAEYLSRCPHVRKLHVFMHPMPDFIAGALIDLLPRLTSLDTLFASIERTLDAHPDLLPPFAALQAVETIFMISAGVRSCELLKSLQSQLVSAVIYFDPADPTREQLSSNANFHLLVLLQKSAPTLKSLVSAFWSDMLGTMFFEPDVTYPNMDSFILHKGSPMNLSSYITAFPNLVHLCVEDDRPNPWEQGQRRVAQLQRDMNLELPGFTPSGESLSWRHLQDYTGPLVDLWLLGLTCPIQHLNLEDTPTTRPPLALTDVVAYARPTELTVLFRKCSLTDVTESDFLSVLHTKGAEGLRVLSFVVWLRAGDRDLNVGRALDDIVATVSGLNRLTRLVIGVNDGGLDGSEETGSGEFESTPQAAGEATGAGAGAAAPHVHAHAHTQTSQAVNGTPHACPAESLSLGERTLDAVDVPAFAARLAEAIPALEDLFVVVQRPSRSGSHLRVRMARVVGSGFQLGGKVHYTESEGYTELLRLQGEIC